MEGHWHDSPGWEVMFRAMQIASEPGEVCRPIHLLAALAEIDGPIADVLRSHDDGPLLPRLADPPEVHGGSTGYLVAQTQRAAYQLARDPQAGGDPRLEGHPPALMAEHLLVAVIDQSEPEATAAMTSAGLDRTAVRQVALGRLGAPLDLPPITMPPLAAAGTSDRPALPVDRLDAGAWGLLRWRQEHLPLDRIRRAGDWHALSSLERRAVGRVADRLGLDDDQRYSLAAHHNAEVERRAHVARPALVETRQQLRERHPGVWRSGPTRRSLWRRSVPGFMVGWPTWFRNRRVGWRDRRFRLATLLAYRGQPWPTARA